MRRLTAIRAGVLWLSLWPLAGAAAPVKSEVSVAAASNLTAVFQLVGEAFEKATGIHPVFSFGSTAQLTRQIQDGAPFDVFAAADTRHIDELAGKGYLAPGSRAVYATGVLAVWFPGGAGKRVEDLAAPGVRVIAIARPELAPYGEAAVETLRSLDLWERVKARVVYGGSVMMAKQYGSTGNADAVFVPYALVLKEKGTVVLVEPQRHRPIEQGLGVVAASRRKDAAVRFAEFLAKGQGHAILLANGYR